MRGHLRAGADARGTRSHARARRSRGRLLARLHLPEGRRAHRSGARPRRPADADGARRRWVPGSVVGRSLRTRRHRTAAAHRIARPRRRRRLPREPQRAQPRRPALQPRAPARARDVEPLHGDQRRPDAQAGVLGVHVRHGFVGPDPGRRSHGPHGDPRRQPARVERQPVHGAGSPGSVARAGASSSSSIRGAPRRPRSPTSTTSSSPAPTRTCCSASCTRSSPRDW